MKIKLQEYLKRYGYAHSNKGAKRLIRDQIVTVNGVKVKSCSIMVPSQKSSSIQVLKINGDQDVGNVVENASPDSLCIIYNKPCGMICTTSTSEGGYCLNQIDPSIPDYFQPVGRLDQHSHGLLLFSMDGRLTSAFLSPRTAIERTYRIIVKGDVGARNLCGGAADCSSDEQLGRYDEICNIVKAGVQTDYGFFKGRIIAMERNVNKDYEHSKCGMFCGGKRNDTFNERVAKNSKHDVHKTALKDPSDCVLSEITVAVKEGKKRMVRRLFAAISLFVVGEYDLIL
jgi:16S rRNA U516 pseudouridylate synthase RsuA-like enzyme